MWRIAAPMIISNISIPLVGITDTIITGYLDNSEFIASIAVASAIIGFFIASMNFLRMGTTGITAQRFGAGDFNGSKVVLYQALILAIAFSLIILLCQIQINAFGQFLIGANESVKYFASEYFHIRIWGMPATLINFVLIGWFIGMQDAKTPLKMVIATNLSNIILSLVFVLAFKMQINGIALASVFAEIIGMLVGLIHVKTELQKYKNIPILREILDLQSYRKILSINLSLFIRTISLIFTFAFITAQGARFGPVILGANAILMNLQNLLAYILDGFAHAAEAMVGKAIGREDQKLLQNTINICLRWSIYIAIIISIFYLIFGKNILQIMTQHEAIKEAAIEYLPWMIISPIISVWSFLYDGVFIGATRSKEMRDAMLGSLFVVFLPSWFLLKPLGNHGLWLAFTIFMISRGVSMYLFYKRTKFISFSHR